ncbi:MAG TPA: hypothetical protein DCP90_03785 [Clostridiales bacterium]|nr:MAG: hypothetical protein A2Y22_05300 [Clostridiales bacterium GWD2_32_59]HAN09716.1 hypothetical protein [Clostridiales bacterium]
MKINNNIPALRSLHLLDRTNSALDKTLEKLSSGKRINRAADDAAGLAIAQKMDTQVRGLEIATRNSNDGISLIQTAEGALAEVHSMLQRMRELCIQASNGTLSSDDRDSINNEVVQLKEEIARISDTTEFNEMKLLNGDIDRRAFSTNSNVADIVAMSDTVNPANYTFEVTQSATKTKDTGGAVSLFDGSGESTLSGYVNINGEQVYIESGESSENVFAKIRNLADTAGVNATTTSPFGNSKAITLEAQLFGEKDITVTGDTDLIEALGLDSVHFNPNTEGEYTKTSNVGISIGALDGDVLINGIEVNFLNTDAIADILSKLKSKDIPGTEFALNGAGAIVAMSTKPIVIEAKTTAAGDIAVAADLASLAAGVQISASSVKCEPEDNIDKTATIQGAVAPAGADLEIMVNGVSAGSYHFAADLDLSIPANIETLVGNLNAVGVANTTFTLDQTGEKLIAYNTNGDTVTIVPSDNGDTDDVNAAGFLGYSNSTVSVQTGFGNKGHSIEVSPTNIVFDNPSTATIEGFPMGTTVTTSGKRIVFEGSEGFQLTLQGGDNTGNVTVNILETGPLDLQIGANEGQFMAIRIQNLSPEALGIEDLNLSTAALAQDAITIIDKAINTISSVRSKLGAFQNRLEHTIQSLTVASENMTASLSRIEDADMAFEMSEYTKQNVLSQAGVSMLAQANQRPQSILQLLQQ